MQVTTLSFANMHEHGALFPNLLRARHASFIVRNNWPLPEDDGMEYDQYDTPASRWVCVHDNGRILAGGRLTPTTAKCGIYSYMVKDAQEGLLDTIPKDLLWGKAPVEANVWEGSRGFVSHLVPAKDRLRVQTQLSIEVVRAARALGASNLIGIFPYASQRLCRRVGIITEPAGPIMKLDGVDCLCVTIDMTQKLH